MKKIAALFLIICLTVCLFSGCASRRTEAPVELIVFAAVGFTPIA